MRSVSGNKENIFKAFSLAVAKFQNRTAVIYLGTRFSYQKILHLAERFASSLVDMGVKQNDRIILYIPNSIQWIVAWLGTQRAGAVAVPITPI
ncbi:MAG: AMP-binding protein [Deltaproteobacteria bacterium]|nr:AMP-binding protein [Deltaproteobacteria bacterium]